jgi:hypothetical protein
VLVSRSAQSITELPVPVTVENFCRAESDMYFAKFVRDGGLGRFAHHRELPLENTGVRPNRDTLYSIAVFDLDAGDVTITLPDAGTRFMTMLVIDEDHYAPVVVYGKGTYRLDRDKIDTRYVSAAVRTLVDPADPEDLKRVHALQDEIKVSQSTVGKFEMPNWDPVSQKRVRDALLTLSETLPDLRTAGGRRGEVDPVRHLVATASGWGLNPDRDAIYLNITPAQNDGSGVYRLTVRDVPVDGFWSVTVYDGSGHFQKNALNAYSVNNITAKTEADGSVVIQFGGCEDKTSNCLPIMSGWNYMVRLYRPRAEVLNDTWQFPGMEMLP